MRRIAFAILPPLLVFVLAILAAQKFVEWGHIKEYNFPAPSAVWDSLKQPRFRSELLSSSLSTAKAALAGFSLSAIIGVGLAMLFSTSRIIQRAFYPYTVFFQTVPIIAIAPLLVIWFDFGFKPVAASAFIASVFPVIANTLTGLLSTEPPLRDMFRLYRASRLATMFKLKLPSALPNIVTGLRIAAGLAVIGAIVGEFVAGTLSSGAGLGITLLVAKKRGDTPQIFAAVLAASALGLAMLASINLAGYLLLRRWHASEQE